MADVWSFNTTLRNPERMENMLRALSELEGVDFDESGQEAFFGLIIKKRLYRPSRGTLQDPELVASVYDDKTADDLDDVIVEKILSLYRKAEVNGSGRGRAPAGALNRFGLVIANKSKGKVRLTTLGKKWLAGDIDDEELFTKFLLKWEYPNRIETGYSSFSIKPFVGVLSLINRVNILWARNGYKSVGLSKDEYKLFATSLKKAENINEYAKRIINYRLKKKELSGKVLSDFAQEFERSRAKEIFGNSQDLVKPLNNLRDYADSSIRYFHASGLVTLRGSNRYIDIAQDRVVEVNSILQEVSPEPRGFDSFDKYLDYLADVNSLKLPWQNEGDLRKISSQLTKVLRDESKNNDIEESIIQGTSKNALIEQVDSLHNLINDVRLKKLRQLKHDVQDLDESISRLESLRSPQYVTTTARPSLDFEWYATRALMVLNDAEQILPSFKVGDDGIPTGFRGNKSDIECLYQTYGMTVEVTLLLGRDQWYAEGQPVMRHLRDFENSPRTTDLNYSLFIAPLIHRDSLNTFWGSNKIGYEGMIQKIIPLTTTQFIQILRIAKKKIEHNRFDHTELGQLFDSFFANIETENDPYAWTQGFDAQIAAWAV